METMNPIDLLKAKHVGARELKDHLAKYMRGHAPVVATDRGQPKKVLIDYQDMVTLIEMVADLSNPALMKVMAAGARAVRGGAAGLPVKRLAGARGR